MTSFGSMTRKAQLYWMAVVVASAVSFRFSLATWHVGRNDLVYFIVTFLFATVSAGFKIRLPGVLGTLSTNYVVILAALLHFDRGAGVAIAVTSTLVQCLIHTQKRPYWFQVVFSTAGVSVPVSAAGMLLHSATVKQLDNTGTLALLAAAMAYFLVNTAIVAGVIGLTSATSPWDVWTKSYLWTFPQYLVGGLAAGGAHFLETLFGWVGLLIALPPMYLLYVSYSNYLGRLTEQQEHIANIAALHLRTIETLALAIDAKDDTTAAHLRRVQVYAGAIGAELNLSALDLQALNAAALLHDVGKLAVPEYIISKPGKLTPEEFEKMKVHPVVGAEILERVNFPYPVVPIVRSHHEKYDGTGYPDGLAGENIPIGARILAAVDCLDALATDRQYRQALPLAEAMRLVAKDSGKAFDPKVVDVLQRRYMELEQTAKEQTMECTRLSTNIKVERGLEPATGFAKSDRPEPGVSRPEANFSTSIAGARREIQLLTEVINDLGNSLSLNDTLALLANRLERAVQHDTIVVYLLQKDKLTPRMARGDSYRLFSSLTIPVGQGLSGWVAENRAAILNGNPAVEPGYLNDPRCVTPLRSAVSVPLISDAGLVGVLTLYSLGADAFTTDNKRLLLAIAPKAAHAIENSLRFEVTASAADKDELTGVANARMLFAHLQQEVARCSAIGESFAVIVMDLDSFKQANDRFGHLAGNRILQTVARSLNQNTRAGDLVGRLGGDEFVVVLDGTEEKWSDYLSHINQISARLGKEAQCEAGVSISSGLATFPRDGADAEALLACADERMYTGKRARKLLRVA